LTISPSTAAHTWRNACASRHAAVSGHDPEENRFDPDVFGAAASHEVAANTIGVVR
jgi:hypothetical protein